MADRKVAPYGAWQSPISADLIVAGSIPLGGPAIDGADIYWTEGRPLEGGRTVLVRRSPGGQPHDITPAGFNVRSRVHEYGGGAYLVDAGVVYFSNFSDCLVYRQDPGAAPRPITADRALRYADFALDRTRGRLICVREDHRAGDQDAVSSLVALSLDGSGADTELVAGGDFYSSPRLSPDGARLCWLTWNHPNMPWDGTELWVTDLGADGSLGPAERVAGGPDESIFQPEWSPDGTLHFVSDRTGWWNLYRWRAGQAEALCPMEAEFGLPQWAFGMATYGFEPSGRIVCTFLTRGIAGLARLNPETGALEQIQQPYTTISGLRVSGGRAVFVGGSPTRPKAIAELDLASSATVELRRSLDATIAPGYISVPEPIEFPTSGGLTAHAFYYPPSNPAYRGPDRERPPLLVISHGGPTGSAAAVYDLDILYWTSRGFGVADVNYGGSTGFGRAYRRRLDGQWGVVDVDDCAAAARFLVARGDADERRLAIRGESAGGYTTLCALTFTHDFQAGASYYGVGDPAALARETHKFESRYMDRLIGPYPEQQALYEARSPILHTGQLECPVIVLQGADDMIVPPSQAEQIVAALRSKGLPVAYLLFEGEGHGFRRAENIKRALEAELYFYGRVLGFDPADQVEPIEIANL